MLGAGKGGFQIVQHRIDPAKLGTLDRLRASAYDVAFVRGVGNGCDSTKASQSIGEHMCAGGQRLSCPIGKRLFSEARRRCQAHQMRLARTFGVETEHDSSP